MFFLHRSQILVKKIDLVEMVDENTMLINKTNNITHHVTKRWKVILIHNNNNQNSQTNQLTISYLVYHMQNHI